MYCFVCMCLVILVELWANLGLEDGDGGAHASSDLSNAQRGNSIGGKGS